jgi:WD40 repeat protein
MDTKVRLWDVAKGVVLQMLEGHSDVVMSVAFSPNGKQVVSGSWDRTVQLWDTATIGAPLKIPKGHSSWVTSVAFSPDGKQVVSGSDDETVRLWDAATGALLRTLEGHSGWVKGHSDWVKSVAFWDTATGELLQTLEGHSGGITAVAFSPDGKQVVSGSWDGTKQLWDTTTGAPLQTLAGHSNRVTAVASSPDSKLLQTLRVSEDWVVEGMSNILWLPPDYLLPTCQATWNGIIVLGYSTGRISFFEFTPGAKFIISK